MPSPTCNICRNLKPPLRPGSHEAVRFCLIKNLYEQAARGCEHCQLLKTSFEAVEGKSTENALAQSGQLTSAEFRIICEKVDLDKWKVRCIYVNDQYRLTFEIFGVEGEPFKLLEKGASI